ncbi:MAG TPA: hypothetical protein VFP97_01300 [Chitinophagaceae bacterium]|nr:hypothetical protein [Chitinophagaceae bacterium]
MTDTPEHTRNLQLKLWLAKPPEERLLQFIMENDAWWKALQQTKETLQAKNFQNKQDK